MGSIALVAYLGLVVVLTWPLGANLATHLPRTAIGCKVDARFTGWALAWETHALVTQPRAFFDANIYHPTPAGLLYGPLGLGALPVFAPVFAVTNNPTLALNVTYLGWVALAAWGLHQVMWWWTGSTIAGFVAASAFLGNEWTLWAWIPTAPHHAAVAWFPWILAVAAGPMTGWRSVVGLAALVALQGLTDLVYVAPAVLLSLGGLAVVRMVRASSRASGWRILGAAGLAGIALSPLYLAYAWVRLTQPTGSIWDGRLVPDVAGLMRLGDSLLAPAIVLPDPTHPPFGIPWVVIAVVAAGFARAGRFAADHRWRTVLYLTLVALVVSVPAVQVGTWTMVSPLFRVIAAVAPAVLTVIRVPMRLGITVIFGTALLAALVVAALIRASPRLGRVVGVVVAMLALAQMWWVRPGPYPIVEAPSSTSPVDAELRRGRGAVMEIGGRTGGIGDIGLHADAMYRSIYHWRPLVGGYSSFYPMDQLSRMSVERMLPSARGLRRAFRQLGVRHVVVRASPFLANFRNWLPILRGGSHPNLRLVARDDQRILFEIVPAPGW